MVIHNVIMPKLVQIIFTMKSIFLIIIFLFVKVLSVNCIAQQLVWNEVLPGIWKAVAGKPEAYNLLSASGALPNKAAIANIANTGFPFNKTDIAAKIIDGKTYLRFPLIKEEQLYGFGLNFQTVQQRGRIMQLHVDHYEGKDNGRTHSPTPFYVSSNGYGVFINSARYLDVYAGTGVRKDSKNKPAEQDRNTDKNWNAQPFQMR